MRSRRRTIDMPWGRLRVWETGDGPPLLAIHGLGGSGRYWSGLGPALDGRFRVIAPDLAGFGSSDKPSEGYTRELHLSSIDAALEGIEEPVTVCCHSIGSVLGILWTIDNADRVERIATAAAPFPSPGPKMFSDGGYTPGATAKLLGATLRTAWPVLALPVALARAYPHAVVRDFGRQSVRGRTGTLWSLLYDPDTKAAVERAAELDVPALIMHAQDDRTVGIGAQQRWAHLLPKAEPLVLPSGGHQFLLTGGFAPLKDWLAGKKTS